MAKITLNDLPPLFVSTDGQIDRDAVSAAIVRETVFYANKGGMSYNNAHTFATLKINTRAAVELESSQAKGFALNTNGD